MARERKAGKRPLLKRKGFWWPVGIIGGLVAVTVIAFSVSPWPGALVIRGVFDKNAADVKAALEPHAPKGITRVADVQYRDGDGDALLDVYYPKDTAKGESLPVVIWTHGGAWISGSKTDAEPYYRILASHGYTVISLAYSYGPEKQYSTAVFQINDALQFVLDNAERFHADTDRIVMAGDSAGSQLTSQIAALTTNGQFAADLEFTPALRPDQLRGLVLTCGVYDMKSLARDVDGLTGWGFDVATWAYTGVREYDKDPRISKEMSSIEHVTANFPPTFITGGNGDALTDAQSKPLAAKLEQFNVPVTTLFFPADYEPALPHEYQFNLDNEAGQQALDAILTFIASSTT